MNHRHSTATLLFAFMVAMGGVVHAQDVSEQFKRLDRNKDGKLTKDEFSGALFDRIDTSNDGIITADEDRAFVRNRPGQGQNPRLAESIEARFDLPYAGTDNPRQTLDRYLPNDRKDDKPLPVVVFIHGGAWQAGDKRGGYRTIAPLVESGDCIGVSLGYRLTGESIWPTQIHDCKAAIRWLRANAEKYHLDPNKIGVTGTSAGGHLVAMLGTTGEVPELEGTLGEALLKVGVESILVPVEGGGHGGFPPIELADRLRKFFDKHLLGEDVVISSEPIKQSG